MLFLDTNVVSEIRLVSSGKADLRFIEWVKQMDTRHCWTSAVVLMELERGVLRMERKDPVQGGNLRYWFNTTVRSLFENRVLKIDHTTAQICAKLHIPNKRPENDAWIAASCIQHNLSLVTRNVADFQNLDIELINPFDWPMHF